MVRVNFIRSASAVALVLGFGAVARATPVPSIRFADGDVLDVQQVVGSGPNTVYAVFNFDANSSVNPPPVFAYQYDYSYDSSKPVSIAQVFDDIAAAPGSDLTVTYYPGSGEDFVDNFTHGTASGTMPGDYNFQTGVYSASDVSASDNQGITFTDLQMGVAAVDLSPTYDFIGTQGLDASYNAPPVVAPEVAVPEPATAGLCLAATAIGLLGRRRRA